MPFQGGVGQIMASSQFYLYGRRSFGRSGWLRAAAAYKQPDLLGVIPGQDKQSIVPGLSLVGKTFMVTGANSGVGFETSKFLALHGARVYAVCRNPKKAAAAVAKIVEAAKKSSSRSNSTTTPRPGNTTPDVRVLIADVSLEKDVRRLWIDFVKRDSDVSAEGEESSSGTNSSKTASSKVEQKKKSGVQPKLDGLICNAGALMSERTVTTEGWEVTFAAHLLFGSYLLGSLATPALEACPGTGRLVFVSSGGMYNTKWPGLKQAAALPDALAKAPYDGQFSYAVAKRGQVLLAERWGAAAKASSKLKVVTCHPGWTATPGVDAAYGDKKKYLGDMRTPWQGAEGIAWLCVAPGQSLVNGAFYLDREPRTKHISGPFFSEGWHTKNSAAEIDQFMADLQGAAAGTSRPAVPGSKAALQENAEATARAKPLVATSQKVDLDRFMGRWFVHGNIPTLLERGIVDPVEEYSWADAKKSTIKVRFTYRSTAKAQLSTLMQKCTIVNAPTCSHWAMSPKVGPVYLPLGLDYLIADCTPDYSWCIIGVPNRDYLWIMSRQVKLDETEFASAINRAVVLGYDASKIICIKHTQMVGTNSTAVAECCGARK